MKKDTEPNATSFGNTLAEIRKGDALSELSEQLQQLVAKVRLTGLKGKLTLTITADLSRNGKTLDISDDIVLKLPKTPTPVTTFFATEENVLVRDNPDQREMNFAVVSGGVREQTAVNAQ